LGFLAGMGLKPGADTGKKTGQKRTETFKNYFFELILAKLLVFFTNFGRKS